MTEYYYVNHKGMILAEKDLSINDGAWWCVDYNGKATGEIAIKKETDQLFAGLDRAVQYSRDVRAALLTKEYQERLKEILDGEYIADFKTLGGK